MALFYIKCPKCGQELEVQDEWVGMEAECPLCQEKIIIPERPAPTLRLKLREEDKSTFTQPPQNTGYTSETPKKKKKPSVEISKGAIVIFVIAIIGLFCVLLGASFIGFAIAIISMLVARKIRKNMSDAETEQSVFSISTKSFTWSTTVIALIAGFLSIKADFSNPEETSRKIAQTAMCIDKLCENFNLAFRATKYTGHEAACKNNLYLAGTILKQYHSTYKKYPDCEEGDTLDGIIQAYRQKLYEGHDEKPDNSITYHCPLDGKPLCYIGNTSAQDSTIPLAYCPNHKNQDGSYRNVLFADGHTGEGKISLRKKQPVNDKKVSIKTQTQKVENKSAGYSVEIEVSAPRTDAQNESLCIEHLRAIGIALKRYASTHNKAYPKENGTEGLKQLNGATQNDLCCPIDSTPYIYMGGMKDNTRYFDGKVNETAMEIPVAYCPNHKNETQYTAVLQKNGKVSAVWKEVIELVSLYSAALKNATKFEREVLDNTIQSSLIALKCYLKIRDDSAKKYGKNSSQYKKAEKTVQDWFSENKQRFIDSAKKSDENMLVFTGKKVMKSSVSNDKAAKEKYNHAYDMLFNKKGAEREEGLRILKEMAASGNAEACKDLATWYTLERNSPMTFFYYRKGAELNNAFCQYSCGMSYMAGDGVQKNEYEGIRWLIKASNNNDAESQYMLYLYYSIGKGCQRNKQEAIKWLKKSASQGHKKALENMKNEGFSLDKSQSNTTNGPIKFKPIEFKPFPKRKLKPMQTGNRTRTNSSTADTLRKIVVHNLNALQNENMNEALYDIDAPLRAGMKTQVREMFARYDLSYRLVSFELLSCDGTTARVKVVQDTRKRRGPAFTNNRVTVIHTFKKRPDGWKITATEIVSFVKLYN